uniref:Uncharacterized protein n=1 Tax=Arundo donax TaxID=35708 RepID=A0A0A8Y2K4_ARUDO
MHIQGPSQLQLYSYPLPNTFVMQEFKSY